jgi:hypothetical protein
VCTFGCTTGDFAVEIGSELAFFGRRLTGRNPSTVPTTDKPDFDRAFGVEGYAPVGSGQRAGTYTFSVPRMSHDDNIRLMPYPGSPSHHRDVSSPEYDDVGKLETSTHAV